MITKIIFRTYKDNFPLILLKNRGTIYLSFNGDALDGLVTELILELGDLATLPPLAYISRHIPDKKVPPEHLAPFLAKFPGFVNHHGQHQTYHIPTVWLVGHFEDSESAAEVRQKLNEMNIKYFDEVTEHESFDEFNQAYWQESSDAEPFVKFIHQTTMIGLDLLRMDEYKEKLGQLGRLEYIQYTNAEDMKSDLREMERYLSERSQYYRENITGNPSEYEKFWVNFTKWKTSEIGTGSWPHFLFNICGVPYPPTHPPLKVRPEDLFEGWW